MFFCFIRARRVFLCYSRPLGEVGLVAAALERRGYHVTFDRHFAGANFDMAARKAIRRCDVFVFFVSPESVRDKSMCDNEIERYKQRDPSFESMLLVTHRRDVATEDLRADLQHFALLAPPKGYFDLKVADEVEKRFPPIRVSVSGLIYWAAVAIATAAIGYFGGGFLQPIVGHGQSAGTSAELRGWRVAMSAPVLLLGLLVPPIQYVYARIMLARHRSTDRQGQS